MGRQRDTTDRPEERTCRSCGRRIEWRRAWADDWDEVRWCSAACRRRKVRPVDRELEAAITALLTRQPRGATIRPSEVARAVAGDDEQRARALLEPARAAARRLVAAGRVEVVQHGRVVDPSTAKGPIGIRATDG